MLHRFRPTVTPSVSACVRFELGGEDSQCVLAGGCLLGDTDDDLDVEQHVEILGRT